jgi:hypothetical protein
VLCVGFGKDEVAIQFELFVKGMFCHEPCSSVRRINAMVEVWDESWHTVKKADEGGQDLLWRFGEARKGS